MEVQVSRPGGVTSNSRAIARNSNAGLGLELPAQQGIRKFDCYYLSLNPVLATESFGKMLDLMKLFPEIQSCKFAGPASLGIRSDHLIFYMNHKWDPELKAFLQQLNKALDPSALADLSIPACARIAPGIHYGENRSTGLISHSRGGDLCMATARIMKEMPECQSIETFRAGVLSAVERQGINPVQPYKYLP